jgi:hypothetical protein
VGFGSTDDYSCMHVLYGSGSAGASWTAFPSPGDFPQGAISPTGWYSLDDTGWTVQSDSINLSSASVTVKQDGTTRSVDVRSLAGGYGSSYAISIIPDGFTTKLGSTYEVEVIAGSTTIAYEFTVVDCS